MDVFIRRPVAAELSQEVELLAHSIRDTPTITLHCQGCCLHLPPFCALQFLNR